MSVEASPSGQIVVREKGSWVVHSGCATHRRSYDWLVRGERQLVLALCTFDAPCLAARSKERTNDGWFTLWVPTGDAVTHTVGRQSFVVRKGEYHIINPDEVNRASALTPRSKCQWTTVGINPGWLQAVVQRLGMRASGLAVRFESSPHACPTRLTRALEELRESFDQANHFGALALVESAAHHLVQLLLALHPNTVRDGRQDVLVSRSNPRLQEAVEFIHAHYYRPLTVEQVAEAAAVSVRHLTSLFRQGINMTPSHYLRAHRIQRAIERLQNEPHLTLEAIAEAVGYGDARALRAAFHAEKHTSPSSYRR